LLAHLFDKYLVEVLKRLKDRFDMKGLYVPFLLLPRMQGYFFVSGRNSINGCAFSFQFGAGLEGLYFGFFQEVADSK
jgi:hypothetical protein